MIDTKLNDAIHFLESARFKLQDKNNVLHDLKTQETKLKRQLKEAQATVDELQVQFDKAMMNMRLLMSGRDSEVEVLVATTDASDQVGREG